MKKILFMALMAVVALGANAQNVQVHYDFGRSFYSDQEDGRQRVTVTLEQFKADQWGSWYYFVDVDLTNKFTEGAYTEISREFNIGKNGFAAHVEYDGGLNRFGSFQQAALVGAAYNGHNADFSKTWSAQLMYKRYFRATTTHRLTTLFSSLVYGVLTSLTTSAPSLVSLICGVVKMLMVMVSWYSSQNLSSGITSPITSALVPRLSLATTSFTILTMIRRSSLTQLSQLSGTSK